MNSDEIVSFPGRGTEASHLSYEELEAWVDGRADAVDRELVDGHVAVCRSCAAELDDLRRVRESLGSRRRWWIAAAAAVVLIALLSLTLIKSEKKPVVVATQTTTETIAPPVVAAPRTLAKPVILATLVTEPGAMRGTSRPARKLKLDAPVATVVLDDRPNFRWSAAAGASEYSVAVADHATGAGAASGSTTATWWRPEEPLARGRTYTWQVTAHAGDERWTVPQPPDAEALFHVASSEAVQEIEAVPVDHHLDRGIALAGYGALDDAEREFKRAADEGIAEAETLLEQVQAWRLQ